MAANQSQIEPIEWPAPVRRVLARWDGKAWAIVEDLYVPSMTLPAPDLLPDGDRSRGFWAEAIDAKGRVRHRQALADPFNGMELFEADGEITRIMHPAHLEHSMTVEFMVPDLPDLVEIHIFSNPLTATEGDGRARRFVLKLPTKGGKGNQPGRQPRKSP